METVTLTEADAGRSIAVTPGQHVVVRLPENPTTGYRWSVPVALEVAADTYERGGGGVGAGGQRVLTLVAPAQATQVELRLQRPHGGDAAQIFTVMFQPQVQ